MKKKSRLTTRQKSIVQRVPKCPVKLSLNLTVIVADKQETREYSRRLEMAIMGLGASVAVQAVVTSLEIEGDEHTHYRLNVPYDPTHGGILSVTEASSPLSNPVSVPGRY